MNGFGSLDAALAWLDGLINVERALQTAHRRLSLDPVTRLLDRLDHPERGLSVLHIAGSKGKGSTALLAESLLRAAGERVGTFTSPHLERWTERFRIDGGEVTAPVLLGALDRVRPHVDQLLSDPDEPDPSFFDVTTAAALLLFRDAGLDRVVLEVGLGGRLDSTNVVDPAITCITSIELEHTDRLGHTLAAIAREKAGIVKPGRPVVTGRLPPEAAEVVAARATELHAPLAVLGRDFQVETCGEPTLLGVGLRFHDGSCIVDAALPVAGRHQVENAALALACVRRLRDEPSAAFAEAATRGLAQVSLPGRVEVLGERPWLVVDSAHTEHSAAALASIVAGVARRRARLVLSVSSDKRLEAILAQLLPLADEVFVTRAQPVRSLDPAQVARAVRAAAPLLPFHAVPNPFLAIRAACEGLGEEDLLLVTGSVYLAGIARRILRERLTG